jgi:hypothetical protein
LLGWRAGADAADRAAGAALAGPPTAHVVPIGQNLAVLEWRLMTFDGRRPTAFRGTETGAIEIATDSSMAVLYRPIHIDVRATPCLTWRWRVDESSVPAADLGRRGQDDRPLMVSVGFVFQPDRASFWERVRHTVLSRATDREIPGRVLAYVWGGNGARGDRVQSPQLEAAGLMRILRSNGDALKTWYTESVNLVDDFTAQFGYPPPAPIEIAVLGDSDDTRTQSTGAIADIRFTAQCEPPAP